MKESGRAALMAVQACLGLGVREFCVCAGARDAPLVAVLAQMAAGVKITHFADERSAGFFALGRMQATGRPAAVVTTSGTAVAELLPAVVESYYQGRPLVVVSADRPSRFRGSGAPQSIVQPGIFGEHVGIEVDLDLAGDSGEGIETLKSYRLARPVHLNVCFEEPTEEGLRALRGESLAVPEAGEHEPVSAVSREEVETVAAFLKDAEHLLVLLGTLPVAAADPVREFLAGLGAPVWAEATSGLREDPVLDDLLFKGRERVLAEHSWKKVLRVGGVPSLRFWRDLEEAQGIEVLSITSSGHSGLGRESRTLGADPGALLQAVEPAARESSHKELLARDRESAEEVRRLCERFAHSEVSLVRRISWMVGPGALVFLGNSLPIREWNLAARRECFGNAPRCCGNRGANGIDGALSTFLGASREEKESWGIFGDLTALCDLGAPWVLPQLEEGRRRFVIVNNCGGKIFSRLPALRGAGAREREIIENPHAVGFKKWAGMWGMGHHVLRDPEDLQVEDDSAVIEVRPDARESAAFWEELG